jgi:hypothetical protein
MFENRVWSIIKIIESMRTRWTEHATLMEEKRNAYKFSGGKSSTEKTTRKT